jgi:hypothetical protein
MRLKFETTLDFFILFIIFIKIVFILSAIGHLMLSHSKLSTAKKLDPKLLYWKERTEFIFIASMSILLIYHFNPQTGNKPINEETSLIFFLFGWILLLTADWNIFFKEAPWFANIVSYLK